MNLRAVIQVSQVSRPGEPPRGQEGARPGTGRLTSLHFQIVARGLIARGAQGSIVNVSSQASQRALTNHSIYCECPRRHPPRPQPAAGPAHLQSLLTGATKGAMDMLTKVMALELGPHKVGLLG